MGWTHDYRDLTHERGAAGDAALSVSDRGGSPRGVGHDPRIGIPRIIRRRARWVSARLRHPRSR
ncbi:hypothetical protein [Streptomyces varsoviensis]|uniref:hypothetical protein n=1 Tax=Streptomyces varsoviensis TaxID=67373 RepID=UPI0009975F20|nr:hypothetical protein [Streptomyces varsoviensis]